MHARRGAAAGGIWHERHALPLAHAGLLHRHRDDRVAALRQRRRQVLELAGKILVDEEKFHVCLVSTWRNCNEIKIGKAHRSSHYPKRESGLIHCQRFVIGFRACSARSRIFDLRLSQKISVAVVDIGDASWAFTQSVTL
jgi:hypothetical protein